MTLKEQRIAIAEACGITAYDDRPDYGFITKTGVACLVPDYLHDLNAMHEAESFLNLSQVCAYNKALSKSCKVLEGIFSKTGPHGWIFHATAGQRAEAMCRVLWPERWKNTP